jgi:formylmethanofuran dehydrogenase subunit E-like metal-binding protein
MREPTSYYEWTKILEYIKDKPRNDLYIETLNKGTIDADKGLIIKLAGEVENLINYRTQKELNSFMQYLRTSIDYNGLSLELIKLKKELVFDMKLSNIKVFNEEIRKKLSNNVQKQADAIQNVLIEKTKDIDRTGMMNSLVRNNPVNKLEV